MKSREWVSKRSHAPLFWRSAAWRAYSYPCAALTACVAVTVLHVLNFQFSKELGLTRVRGEVPDRLQAAQPRKVRSDFAQALPDTDQSLAILQEARRLSQARKVAISGVRVSRPSGGRAGEKLGHTSMQFVLNGSYAQLKSTVAGLLGKFPNLLLIHIAMRRMSSLTDLEAVVELDVLTSPLMAEESSASDAQSPQ